MPLISALRRHDPWWGVDGSAARARYRRHKLVSALAFMASLVAVGGAGTIWAIHLGFAATLGFRVALAI